MGVLFVASIALASPFDRPAAVAGYATGWDGSYGAGGVGGRIRYEPGEKVGVDLFGESYLVATPTGIRHDHPVGFDLYAPISVGPARLKPLFGMCVVGSFIESKAEDAPGADDLLFGAHTGLGLEVPASDRASGFVEARTIGWLGHDRAVQGWSGSVSSTLRGFVVGQVDFGLTLHLGRPRS
jgi:hypothetical protein